jgi:HlyD family secretion protein
MPKLRLRRWVTMAGAAGLVGLIVWGLMPRPLGVDVAVVQRGALRVTVEHYGKTRVKDRYIVSAPVGGKLKRLIWKPGHEIKPGQLLAEIEPDALDAITQAQAQALVGKAEAAREQALANRDRVRRSHELADQTLQRVRDSARSRGVSQQELDQAVQQELMMCEECRAAQFAVRMAEYELENSKAVLAYRRKRSPGDPPTRFPVLSPIGDYSHRVFRVFQESERSVPSGTQLLEVGDPTSLELEIDVLSADAVKVRPGARMILEHWGGPRPLEGQVRLVEPSGFLKISALGVEEQRVYVIGDLVSPLAERPTLGDAYRVDASIVVWEQDDVLKVPAGALFRHGDDWAVYVISAGTAKLRIVDAGANSGLEREIRSGLEEGETVIVHPSDRIHDGASVAPR